MTAIPDFLTILAAARTEGEMKSLIWGPLGQVLAETLGGAPEEALTIAAGSITPTKSSCNIDTEAAAATDDLTNIDTTNLPDGRMLLIRAVNAAHVVVVKHAAAGAGEVVLVDGLDFSLAKPTTSLLLQRRGASWHQVTRFLDNVITTRGDIVRGSSANLAERLALGSANLLLGSNGSDVLYVGGSEGKVGAYTVVAPGDHMKVFRAAGTFSFTLPPLAASGDFFQFSVVNMGTGIITLDGFSTETFRGPDGTTQTITLPSFGDSVTVVNGTNWEVSSLHRKLAHGLQTPIPTTSGTAHDFTGIPADTTRITALLSGVSLSGTDHLLVQLGDSGGFQTTGYASTGNAANAAATSQASSTAGFIMHAGAATNTISGRMVLELIDPTTNTWVASHAGKKNTTAVIWGGGDTSLSGVLTQVRLTRTGTDTTDAGIVNALLE